MKKVIIIDDNKFQTGILESFFKKNSWETIACESAKEGYEKIFSTVPDLIITDALMPNIGGFQFLKTIRNNELISKIPVIIYSVLPEKNVRLYIKEERGDFFVKKNENLEELLTAANEAIFKCPISEEYKNTILAANFIEPKEIIIPHKEEITEREKLTLEELRKIFIEKIDFEKKAELLIPALLTKIHSILKFNLGILHIPSNENLKNKLFFDIENILLSPIFQFDMLEKQGAQDPILYKKYAPNLKTITNENEFSKKEELEIIYHEKLLSKFIFYYLRNTSTLNEEEFVLLKEILKEFFKKWHIINTLNKKERFSSHNKYIELNTISDIKANIQEKEVYCGIIKINNLEEISTNLQQEDINVITSIISKEIKSYLDKEEKLYKVELDEYDFAIYADNKKEAEIKLNKIANTINNLVYNTYNFKTTIAAVLCNGENNKITGEKALDIAREILINSDENEKVIIK